VEQVPAQQLYESTGFEVTRRSVLTNDTGSYRLIHDRRQLGAEDIDRLVRARRITIR
jgi:hypothetical protein